ncbi:MAG: TIGR01777 family oxidoreductase [Actinomycetes bacterium]
MPVFERVSRYPHPRAAVFAWHTRPGAFVRLTPPGMATMLRPPTDGINPGSEVLLRLSHPLIAGLLPSLPVGKKGPVGVNWRVRHVELVPGELFVDEQVRGPFKSWRHEHVFSDGPGDSTVITDRITWELPVNLPGSLDQALVEMQLDGLFAFRERQLRDDLDVHARLSASPRRIVVAGASGLIGSQLCGLLTSGGHTVVRLVRSGTAVPSTDGGKQDQPARWDPAKGWVEPGALQGADAVVNLAGHSIGGHFTRKHEAKILSSRLDATTTLVKALTASGVSTLVQASGIGVYGPRRPGELLTEESEPGDGVLAEVVRAWEGATEPAARAGVRTALLRTGIVLSEGGGALAPQVPLYSIGLGGRLAAPDAWMSWVSLDDTARAYLHALLTDLVVGPVNLVAPRPVTNQEFATTLGRVLHRPALVPTPAFGPKLVLGERGYDQMIDTDQRVSSAKLVDAGFWFAQGNLGDALRHALMR